MERMFENNTLTLCFEGRIDTTNAPAVDAESMAACREHPGCAIVVDAEKLEYISSAGLRVLMKLRKEAGALKIINVNSDVYEILEMTGFIEILDVQKAYRQYSVEGLPIVGAGATGTVYRLDEETIIKVFEPGVSLDMIEKERNTAKHLFVAGVPTAISYDVAKCGDRWAVLYEMLRAGMLSAAFKDHPEQEDELVDKYIELLNATTSVQFEKGTFNSVRGRFLYLVGMFAAAGFTTAEQTEKIKAMLLNIPDTDNLVHGDFHPNNVMVQDGELFVIDLGTAGLGHRIWDLAGIQTVLVVLPDLMPEKTFMARYGMTAEQAKRIWKKLLNRVFADKDAEFIAKVEEQTYLLSMFRMLCGKFYLPETTGTDDETKDKLVNAICGAVDRGLEPICF